MSLQDKIRSDMKTAMKEREKLRLSTIRMLISAMQYAEIDKRESLTDADVQDVIARELKKRRESIEEYKKGKRQDLVDKEEAEAKILQEYMPEQLGDAEVEAIIKQVIEETDAAEPSDLGKVMGQVMPKVKGKADGKKVNEIARRLLS